MLATFQGPSFSDPYRANVSLLAHCNGANAGTSFPDNSPIVHTITAVNQAQTSTAQSKFNGSSGLFDGAGDKLNVPDAVSLTLTGDHTIECWMRTSTVGATSGTLIGKWRTAAMEFLLWRQGATIEFYFAPFSTGSALLTSAVTTLLADTWYHVAVNRTGSAFKLYINGVLQASASNAGVYTDTTGSLEIGDLVDFAGSSFYGYLAEVRLTKGVGRYPAAFSPPIYAFPNF